MNDQNPEVKQGKCGCGNTLFVKKDNRWFCGECVIAYADATKMLEEMAGALSEAQGHFLSIKLGYAFEVGNTPKAISENATQSISDTLDKYRKWKEGIK